MNWREIETAPKNATVTLLFDEGWGNVRSGADKRRIVMPARIINGRWWSASDAFKKVGSRSLEGMRGARIRHDGGYWGLAKSSKPLAGLPCAWMPCEEYIKETIAAADAVEQLEP